MAKTRGSPNPAFPTLICLILVIGLATHSGKPSERSHWLFFIPIAAISIYVVFFCASSNPASDYFTTTFTAMNFFISLDYILLRKFQPELQLSGLPLSEMSLKDSLWWATSLVGNPRGIGWIHEPTTHLPPRPSSTRWKFILSQLMWMVFYILQFDLTNLFVTENPCFSTGGPSLTAFGWLWRSTAWLFVLLLYSWLSLLHSGYSIVSVATGISEPRDWPHLFGSPLDAYTVRNCWGRVWPQALRKVVTGHADFITKQLRLPKHVFTSRFKLFIAFFLSGLIHNAGEYLILQKWAGHSMKIYLLQAVAITCEDMVIALTARVGFSSRPIFFLKLMGFVWVFAWFTYSLPVWLDENIHVATMDGGWNISSWVSSAAGQLPMLVGNYLIGQPQVC